jgi:uncharacterized protein (TIGR02147 family)
MEIFETDSYKEFVRGWVAQQPKSGRGQLSKMAQHLGISPVIITQTFNGNRELNLEHAYELSDFLGLSEMERDYFLLLIQKERAGTHRLKSMFQQKIRDLQTKAGEVKSRLPKETVLKEEAKAVFYSSPYYSILRLMTAIESLQTPQALAEKTHLPPTRVREILGFLVENGLCKKNGDTYHVGPMSTHIDAKSPLVSRHHRNWREQASQKMELMNKSDLFFTAPIVMNTEAAEKVRAILLKTIEDAAKVATEAPSEKLVCLNIDWFEV